MRPNKPIDKDVHIIVNNFSKKLSGFYRTDDNNFISAASKMLWMKYKEPIVIYDSLAFNSLKKLGYKIRMRDYQGYRDAWVEAYSKDKSKIIEACNNLQKDIGKLKKYIWAPTDVNLVEIGEITQSSWFQQRVYDKYLLG